MFRVGQEVREKDCNCQGKIFSVNENFESVDIRITQSPNCNLNPGYAITAKFDDIELLDKYTKRVERMCSK